MSAIPRRRAASALPVVIGSLTLLACPANMPDDPNIISESAEPTALVSDGEDLFMLDARSGSVARMPVSGGDLRILGSAFAHANPFLNVDTARVYFLAEGLVTIDKSGGDKRVLSDGPSSAVLHGAVSETVAYWLEGDPGREVLVKALPLTGGQAMTLARLTVPASRLVVTSHQILVSAPGIVTIRLADPLTVVGAPQVSAESGPCRSLISDKSAAFCVPTRGPIVRFLDDGTSGTIGDVVDASAGGVALDAAYLYVTDRRDGNDVIRRISRDGGESAVAATRRARVIAVDARAIYWSEGRGIGRVVK